MFGKVKSWFNKKSSMYGSFAALIRDSQTPWRYNGSSSYNELLELYSSNPVARRAIDETAELASQIVWGLYAQNGDERNEIPQHDILNLLNMPNQSTSRSAFIRDIVTDRQIGGSYFIKVTQGTMGNVVALHRLNPGLMQFVSSQSTATRKVFRYTGGDGEVFVVEEGVPSNLIYGGTYSIKQDSVLGSSPLSAAASDIQVSNQARMWLHTSLANGASSPGIITSDGVNLTPDQVTEAQRMWAEKYQGAMNSGKPIFMGSAGLKFTPIGSSPGDVKFSEIIGSVDRSISSTLGIPPFLLGQAEGSTFNNMETARISAFEDTIIPIMREITTNLNRSLVRGYYFADGSVELEIDLDKVEALANRRAFVYDRLPKLAGIASTNEKREMVGLSPIDGGDEVLVPPNLLPLGFGLEGADDTGDIADPPADGDGDA